MFRLGFGVGGDDDDHRVHDEHVDNHCARDDATSTGNYGVSGRRSLGR